MVKNTLKSKVHKTQKNQGGGKASKGTKKHNLKRTKGAKGGGKGSRKGGGKGKGGSAPKAPRKKQTKQDEGPDDFVDPTLGPKKRSGRTDEDKQKRAEKFKKEGKSSKAKGDGKGRDEKRERKGPRKRKPDDEEDPDKKEKKPEGFKKKKRREITHLYAELIKDGGERKPDAVVAEIIKIMEERSMPVQDFCSTILGSRCVQACLKWGSRAQRADLLVKLAEHLPKLVMDRYGSLVVLKLLRYTVRGSAGRLPTPDEKKAQVKNLRLFMDKLQGKHLHAAFYHKSGCRVLNGIYFSDIVNAKEKRRILHDIAVPHSLSMLRPELTGSMTLRAMLRPTSEGVTPEERSKIVEHLRECIEKCVDKELLGFDIVHFLFQAYCEVASEESLKTLAEKCMDGAPFLLSSKPGAEALLRLMGVTNSKQRKSFCRDIKGKFLALATNAVDYTVMIRLATTVDDTVLLAKSMLAEWNTDLASLVFDKYGKKVLAWILKPGDRHIFSPYECECASLPSPSSVKALETRQQELVRSLKPPLRTLLLASPLKTVADLHAKDVLVTYLAVDWDAEIIEGILAAAAGEAKAPSAEGDGDPLGLLGSGTAITTIVTLLKLESSADTSSGAELAAPLWRRCLEPYLVKAVTGRCAFVLLELLKGATGKTILTALRKRRGEIEEAVSKAEKSGGQVNGARKLLEHANAAADPGSPKTKRSK